MIERLKRSWENGKVQVRPLDTDSQDYHILEEAARDIVDVKGLTLEIGVRSGGSSRVIVNGIMKSNPRGMRTHIAIDPYGSLDYEYTDSDIIENAYSNALRDMAISSLYRYVAGSQVNFIFFQLTDVEFFKRFPDGVPVYLDNKSRLINTYALVFFDGPHTTKCVMNETRFFEPKTVPGSIFVYDDVENFYNHKKIKKYLLDLGWKPKSSTSIKASYIKT